MTGPALTAVRAEVVAVPLIRPFRTALRSTMTARSVCVTLRFADGLSGVGWSTPVPQVTGETPAGACAAVEEVLAPALVGRPLLERAEALAHLPRCLPGNGSAKAAVDMAWHHAAARHQAVGIGVLLGSAATSVLTDMTLPLAGAAECVAAAVEAVRAGYSCLKLKVDGRPETVEVVRAVSARLPGQVRLRVDANQAWSPRDAVRTVDLLAAGGVVLEYVEQPVAASDVRGLAWVRQRSPFPVLADESVHDATDVARIADAGAADAVNLKLAKSGGAYAALAAAAVASSAGLDVVLGSMLEHPDAVRFGGAVAAAVAPERTHDLDAAAWFGGGDRIYRPPRLVLTESEDAS